METLGGNFVKFVCGFVNVLNWSFCVFCFYFRECSCLHDGNAKPRFGQLVHLCLVLFASVGIRLQTSFLVHWRTDANTVSCVFCLFVGCVSANMAPVKTRRHFEQLADFPW